MENNKKYWKGVEELTNDLEFVKNAGSEFPEANSDGKSEEDDEGTSRRDFLKLMGFGVAAVSLAACEAPIKKAIPYIKKPDTVDPSIANHYASSYMMDGEYCSIVVRTREGRPIKIDGNPSSTVTKGGSNPRVQAALLGLYDLSREQFKKGFLKGGKHISIKNADAEIQSALQAISGPIYLVTPTIISPSTKQVIADFTKAYPGTKHVIYDNASAYGMLKANEESFGVYGIPTYDFSKAQTVVGINADFLGTWMATIEYSCQFAITRKVDRKDKEMSRHYQFETGMSLTGANSDHRTQIKPSQEGEVIKAFYNAIVEGSAVSFKNAKVKKRIEDAVDDLKKTKGKSLLVSGSNDPAIQVLVNAINYHLGNYNTTINIGQPTYLKLGNDEKVDAFVDDVISGGVGAVLFCDTNPVYNHPKGAEFAKALKKVELTISFSNTIDETASNCKFVTPDHHFLESWNDYEPRMGMYSLAQPTISPIFKTRQFQESMLTWVGKPANYYDYIRAYWKTHFFNGNGSFETFWTDTLYKGVFEPNMAKVVPKHAQAETDVLLAIEEEVHHGGGGLEFSGDANRAKSLISSNYKSGAKYELSLYQKVAIGTGVLANNPWLQEMSDPISKATWDNYLCMSIGDAKELKVSQGDVVSISTHGKSLEVPVLIQPGQTKGTFSLAIGYGRTNAGKVGDKVGVNAFPLVSKIGKSNFYGSFDVAVKRTEKTAIIAQTQTQQTIMGRDIVRETNLNVYENEKTYTKFVKDNYEMLIHTSEGPKKPTEISMWDGHLKAYTSNHWWGLVIDMNACTGCSACLISCQVENNVPVVGKNEIKNRRSMQWMRIDRYYSSIVSKEEEDDFKTLTGYKEMEKASEDPEVVFQPMMCQHCNNAPCETVCPVLATTHSSEGLNQMTYNRCFGTRYCANNCPYKIRRFNWFNYTNDVQFEDVNYMSSTDLGKMVLNPDVTVRSRGVMEKCSMCVQRIQDGKLKAKKEKRRLKDGDIDMACVDSCSADAIVFGDMNDENSKISKLLQIKQEIRTEKEEEKISVTIKNDRAYHVLSEINIKPNIAYLTKIRNKKK